MESDRNSKNFALIGAAGYVAPRHMKAIKDTGNRLKAALDKSDSVGILDRFFFDVAFFTEFERFDRHAEKLRRQGEESRIHYVSICSPNYLHDAHIRFALRIGADAVCEKPVVINPWNLDALASLERETGRKVFTILQLRVHPAFIALKEKIDKEGNGARHAIDLTYITARGNWYLNSWKGDLEKSGGIAYNIGIHFFDLLLWIFGATKSHEVYRSDPRTMSGFLSQKKADVRWFLSVDAADLPESCVREGKTTYRSIVVDGEEFEFSEGFSDLHTVLYQDILAGKGLGLEDSRPSINLVYELRNAPIAKARGDSPHPILRGRKG